jgi:Arc/MetJ family transcription regulator
MKRFVPGYWDAMLDWLVTRVTRTIDAKLAARTQKNVKVVTDRD